ncbi:MAG: tRNA (N6-isopentenyl adenosine(37)-C2)-methylthiotransferase MiaB, partial [Coriobacteriales bacterium]|nr:tRNA (N6-isopentenyl adenosine(37)-C2)-methylthiotransferase MiaB [Coriobacteriales bacterium]
FLVRVFGCQMNFHDGERVRGMLDAAGAIEVETIEEADIVVFLTCCVREAADTRLYGQVATISTTPTREGVDHRIIAIGGCIGQRDGEELFKKLPHVDIVFGTHTLYRLPDMLLSAKEGIRHQAALLESDIDGCTASDLPSHRDDSFHAWVPITYGCNNFCTYCIVPYVRGRERSRTKESVLEEIRNLASEGAVKEVTLLGQNVNSYGRDLYGEPQFAKLLAQVGECGIPRIRFATSHPKDLSDETIEVMATTPAIMPALHLPAQSGSSRILKMMNRTYNREQYLTLVNKVKNAIPNIALSTDIIVGFPGETEEDFLDTLSLVQQVGYSQVFTFIYSKREGTPAARIVDTTPREVIQDRFDRLVEVVQTGALAENQRDIDSTVPVLFEGFSKRDATMLVGRSPRNQTVHVPLPSDKSVDDFRGQIIDVHLEEAKTWYLKGSFIHG